MSESSGSQTGQAEHADSNNEEALRVFDEETKTMKEFIDLELQKIRRKKNARNRDLRSFRDAAYALSEKLRKWKWNHKLKKKKNRSGNGDDGDGNGSVDEKPKIAIQSENGECGLGRRSCETDPRISMDWLPRASWDGCLIGRACSCSCSCSCQCPCSTRLSPVEDANGDSVFVNDEGSDNDNDKMGFDDIDGSKSMGEVVEESKPISNANVSPTTTTETELSPRDSNVKSNLIGSTSASGVSVGVRRKGFNKWGFVWNNKLGLVQGREDNKIGERESVVVNVGASEPVVSQKLMRSYSLNCRKPCGGMPGLVNRLGDTDKTRGSDEFMLQRNRSVVGYSISRF